MKTKENHTVFLRQNLPSEFSRWHNTLERILINLIGDLSRPLGTYLRRLFYPAIFARLGKAVYIQKGLDAIGSNAIEIGDGVKILQDVHLNLKASNSRLKIGNYVCLDRGVDIRVAGDDCSIEIGDRTYLGPYVCMAGPGNIKVGKNCLIASQTGIYANNHRDYGLSREGIVIGDYCWLGSGVRILDGVTIGDNSVIGAGAVVTKSIPDRSLAVGVPAKVIKRSKP
jgi:acetyltransferase-like isoleucine patch superfamily enzyme